MYVYLQSLVLYFDLKSKNMKKLMKNYEEENYIPLDDGVPNLFPLNDNFDNFGIVFNQFFVHFVRYFSDNLTNVDLQMCQGIILAVIRLIDIANPQKLFLLESFDMQNKVLHSKQKLDCHTIIEAL